MGFFSKLFGKKDKAEPDSTMEAAITTPTVVEAEAEEAGQTHDHDHDHEGHDHAH